MIVVSDTSPVTTLIQIGKVDLLHKLYGEVLIPEAVRADFPRRINRCRNSFDVCQPQITEK